MSRGKVDEKIANALIHQMKAPLTCIMAYTQLLMAEAGEAEVEHLKGIRRASQRLKRIMNDFLELCRDDATSINLRVAPFPLRSVVEEVLDMLGLTAQGRPVSIHLDVPAVAQVIGDRDRIFDVFLNLIDNAVKFSRLGATVTVRAVPCPRTQCWAVAVIDEGRGIPREQLRGLFERYGPVSADGGDTGLGLYVVRAVLQAHGQDIGVESRPGRGTHFTFTLPTTDAADIAAGVLRMGCLQGDSDCRLCGVGRRHARERQVAGRRGDVPWPLPTSDEASTSESRRSSAS